MNGFPPQASLWAEAENKADGKKYYYNATTGQTTWEKPDELKDEVEVGSILAFTWRSC
jgi:pre-mRNA-processing factor 40